VDPTVGERLLKAGQSWQSGEALKTVDPRSAATLTFREGTRPDIEGASVAVNQSSNQERREALQRGTVRGTLNKHAGRHPFVFTTSEAEAAVVGTALRLVVPRHSTRLEGSEGEVLFRRRHDGAEVAVNAGHHAVVAPNVPLVATLFHSDPHPYV